MHEEILLFLIVISYMITCGAIHLGVSYILWSIWCKFANHYMCHIYVCTTTEGYVMCMSYYIMK